MRLLVSALEHSANVHLKALCCELDESVELVGIFDSSLGDPIVDLRSLAIMGFTDALFKLRLFFKLAAQMVELSCGVDKVLLIDSSGFNLPLAKRLKKAHPDLEIIYYILPQAWAWKRGRIATLQSNIDTLASILPFEREYYALDAPIEYVGHPLLDEIREFKQSASKEIKRVVFMPGSRRSEIKKLMPIFHAVQKKIDVEAVIVVPDHIALDKRDELYGNLSQFVVTSDAHMALMQSDFGFICSGTATLEASLIGMPFALCYIAKPLDYIIAKKLVKLEHIGLANIMFSRSNGRIIHPEFIQDGVNTEALIECMREFDCEQFLDDSKRLRDYLKHGSSKRVADIIKGER